MRGVSLNGEKQSKWRISRAYRTNWRVSKVIKKSAKDSEGLCGIDHSVLTYELIRRRAAGQICMRFFIKHEELWLLCALGGFLKSRGKQLASEVDFFDTITGNGQFKGTINNRLKGLIAKKFIGTAEYIKRAGSRSLGLTDLGYNLIDMYFREVAKLRARYSKDFTIRPMLYADNLYRYRNIA